MYYEYDIHLIIYKKILSKYGDELHYSACLKFIMTSLFTGTIL